MLKNQNNVEVLFRKTLFERFKTNGRWREPDKGFTPYAQTLLTDSAVNNCVTLHFKHFLYKICMI
jgi:hypothetical protein